MKAIKEIVIENKAPEIYWVNLTYLIVTHGLQDLKPILENHQMGGIKLERDELI